MRARWRCLFCCSLGTLVGVTWLASNFQSPPSQWFNLPVLGLILAAGIAFAGMATDTRKRWPAAAALLCAAPMGQGFYQSLSALPLFLRYAEIPGLLMFGGMIGTIASAGYVLAVPPPPPTDDRIPRARSTWHERRGRPR